MKILILVLIAIGVSLDTFAVMVTQGSLMPKIKVKTIFTYIGIFSIWQILAVLGGYFLGRYPLGIYLKDTLNRKYILSAVLILFLGGFIIFKALKKTDFLEKRMDFIDLRNVNYLGILTSLDIFLVSFSLTISSIALGILLILSLINTVIAIVSGIYTGYKYGYEIRNVIRYISAILLIISGIGIII